MPPLKFEPVLDQAGKIDDFGAHGSTFGADEEVGRLGRG
jgi:hypothetical protein